MNRVLPFGKHKNREIKDVIMQHTSYILYLLKNTNFELTGEEQVLFDNISKAIINSPVEVNYSKSELIEFIKDRTSKTPYYINEEGIIYEVC